MKKKQILALAVTALLLALAVGGTFAYFTTSKQAHNIITTNGIDIELVETTIKDGVEVVFPEGGLDGIMPGADASKIVKIKNLATSSEAWVRAKVTRIAINDKDGNPLPKYIKDKEGKDIPVITISNSRGTSYHTEEGEAPDKVYYFYGLDPIAPGATSEVLFDTVHFAKEMGNEYQNCKVIIEVEGQAIQRANNAKKGEKIEDIITVWEGKYEE